MLLKASVGQAPFLFSFSSCRTFHVFLQSPQHVRGIGFLRSRSPVQHTMPSSISISACFPLGVLHAFTDDLHTQFPAMWIISSQMTTVPAFRTSGAARSCIEFEHAAISCCNLAEGRIPRSEIVDGDQRSRALSAAACSAQTSLGGYVHRSRSVISSSKSVWGGTL